MGQLGDWPEEDSGSDTSSYYAFQYHAAARHCCDLLRANGPDWVLCEWHTDYAIGLRGDHILVSVKHRDDVGWRWTRRRLFAEDVLHTLRRRWEDCGRPAECRLVTNATLDRESKALARSCRRGDLKAIREAADSIARGAGAEVDELVDFLRVLRIEASVPARKVIRAANVEKHMVPALAELGLAELPPWDAYDVVVAEVWKSSQGIEDPLDDGWLLSAVGAQGDDALRKTAFERRKITKTRLMRALDKLKPVRQRRRRWHLPYREPTVKRDALLDSLTALLLDDANPLAVVTGVHGAGGFGKTVLAHQACTQPEVLSRYSTLLWTTLGEKIAGPSLATRINDLVAQLGGDRLDFSDPQQAGFRLGEALEDYGGQVLLVVDDVWHRHQVDPFLSGGSNCKRLITTRNRSVVPEGSSTLLVDRMARDEAEALLTGAAHGIPDAELSGLMALTGRWPVLLGIVGRSLRRLIHLGEPPDAAARKLITQLQELGPAAVDLDNPSDRTEAVRATVHAGLDLLPEGGRDRYFELAVFGEDADIPLDVVELLWRQTGGLGRAAVERLCSALYDLSLVSEFRPISGTVRLHDVLRSFLIRENEPERMIGLHSTLLDAAAEPLVDTASDATRPWWSLPEDQDYLVRHVVWHLESARRDDELRALLRSLRWVESRIERHGVAAAEEDLAHAEDPLLERLGRVIRQNAHLLHPTDPPASLGAVLSSRLQSDPALSPLTGPFEASLSRPYLSNHRPLPDTPDQDLQRTLYGNAWGVTEMFTADSGHLLVALDGFNRLNVWNVGTGELVHVMVGDYGSASINRLVAPADGSWVATVESFDDWDGRVRIWNTATGEVRHEFRSRAALPPLGRIPAAVSDDGSRLAIVDLDADEELLLVNVFDAASGALIGSFADREQARVLALSPDGELIAIGDVVDGAQEESPLRLLCCSSGESKTIFHGPVGGVNEIAFSPSGSLVYASDACGDVWVWSIRGELLHRLRCHGRWVHCLMAPDESWMATSDQAGMVRIWDLASGQQRVSSPARTGERFLAISPDSRWLAVGDGRDDPTGTPPGVQVWNAETGLLHRTVHGHVDHIGALVIAADGSWLATGDGISYLSGEQDKLIRIWSLPLSTEDPVPSAGEDEQLESSPKSGRWFTADDEKIQVWNSVTGVGRTVIRTPEPWRVLGSIRNDTILIATAVLDLDDLTEAYPVHVVDVETGATRFTLHHGHHSVRHFIIAPDETWFATADNLVTRDRSAVVRIWDAATGALRHALPDNGEGIGAVAVSPDGSLLITGDVSMEPSECVARVWRVATGEVEAVLPGHGGGVRSLCVANSGEWIATGDDDGNIRIWDTATGELRHTLVGAAEITNIQQSPDGAYLAVCEGLSGVGTLRIWNPLVEKPLAEMRVDGVLYECWWSPDSRLLHATGIRGDYTFTWHP